MAIRYGNIRKPVKQPKREVEFDGRFYKVKSNSVVIPDLQAMSRINALLWLNRETYARGYSRSTNPLAGFAGAITVMGA